MENKYTTTIGLEIHAELKTETKMFCNSRNDPEEKQPNINVCPVCMAHPGTLPVINKEAVRHVIKVGLALNGQIADYTEFDRKNYFYPDLPKGYQISQYAYPLVSGGNLNGVAITRVHLEEDTARSTHEKGDYSLVDFNRAGVPLMELVTEPVIHNAQEAGSFAREIQLLFRYLGVSDANMDKGEMRVEANVSVTSTDQMGTKVEVKNLNSFRSVERAIEYERKRQTEILEKGEKIIQETRGWDEDKQKTFSQRIKEESHDYRYFPDPDLPKLKLQEAFDIGEIKKNLPELPWQKKDRLKIKFGITDEAIEIFVQNNLLGQYFEDVVLGFEKDKDKIQLASNYITSDIAGHIKNKEEVTLPKPHHFRELIDMISQGEISSRGAKDVLKIMHGRDDPPSKIAKEENILQVSDKEDLKPIIEKVIAENQQVVESYKAGKETALQFLVGQTMKATRGRANPQVINKMLRALLEG